MAKTQGEALLTWELSSWCAKKLYPLSIGYLESQSHADLFGGLVHRTARPKFQLGITQISIYVPPKLWWEFWKSKKKKNLIFFQNPNKLHTINTDICHKLLGVKFGYSSPYVRRRHLQHMKSLNQGHLFLQKQVYPTEDIVMVDYN